MDIITSDELHALLDDDRLKGTAFRYALERASIEKVGTWKKHSSDFALRQRGNGYAVRNADVWKKASIAQMRAEVDRMDRHAKDAAFYEDGEDLC